MPRSEPPAKNILLPDDTIAFTPVVLVARVSVSGVNPRLIMGLFVGGHETAGGGG